MPLTDIDDARIRREQTAIWDAVSEGWFAWRRMFESGAGAVSRRLVELAGLGAGDRVLDVGTGLGEPAGTAARAVGATGRVDAVDPSPAMIARARELAGPGSGIRFGVGGVEVAEPPPGGFDAVLSRWSLTFAENREATLRSIASFLRPSGVLAAAVWAAPGAVPLIALGFAAVARYLELGPPPPGGPGPFALDDPDRLAGEVAAAGFARVEVEEMVVPFTLGSARQYARFTEDVLPPRMRALIRERCGEDDLGELRLAVERAASRHAGADGVVHLPSTALCVRATA